MAAMSTSAPPALVDAVSTLFTAEYCGVATFAFFMYDWLINLGEEINCFWDFRKGYRPTAATILYGFSRYSPIAQLLLPLLTIFPMSDSACRINNHLQNASNYIPAFTPAMFSSIRVYALSPNCKTILAISTFLLLFIPGFATIVINAIIKTTEEPSPFNCSISQSPFNVALGYRFTLASRVCYIAGDLLVLFVTWHKTYTLYRGQKGVLNHPSLAGVMLYNGSTYFLIITCMNIFNLIVADAVRSAFVMGNIAGYPFPALTSALTCRFLLDLHQADRTTRAPSSLSAMPSLDFGAVSELEANNPDRETLPAFIASMGEPVYMGSHFADFAGEEDDVAHTNGAGSRRLGEHDFAENPGDE